MKHVLIEYHLRLLKAKVNAPKSILKKITFLHNIQKPASFDIVEILEGLFRDGYDLLNEGVFDVMKMPPPERIIDRKTASRKEARRIDCDAIMRKIGVSETEIPLYSIHHIDGNALNNNLENLVHLPLDVHNKYHCIEKRLHFLNEIHAQGEVVEYLIDCLAESERQIARYINDRNRVLKPSLELYA